MDRRWALAAVWALFATASVGVGFGAAGLVGDPFSDPGSVTAVAPVTTSTPPPATATPTPSDTSSGSPSPSRSSGMHPATSTPPADQPVVRSVTTRGGYVAGSCRSGLVTVSASPAVGWRIDEVDGGPTEEAEVKFQRSNGDGEVQVKARCAGGDTRFEVEDDHDGEDSSGPGGGDE
jgi:hypothetical protein